MKLQTFRDFFALGLVKKIKQSLKCVWCLFSLGASRQYHEHEEEGKDANFTQLSGVHIAGSHFL